MKVILITLAAAVLGYAADSAVLHVNTHGGKFLTFRVENKHRSPITRYEIGVDVPGTGLVCSLSAVVKGPRDLAPPGSCGATDTTNGKPLPMRARLVSVDFADGTRWTTTPAKQ